MQLGKIMKRGFLPTFLMLIAMLMVACGGTTNQGPTVTKATADKQILISPLSGIADIKTFDPGLSTDAPSITAIDMVYTGLVQLDDKLQIKDQLAASHSLGADGLTWTFKLKDGLKFSDGTPLTSADVAYSIDRALDPALKSITSPAYLNLVKDSDQRLAGKVKTLIGDSLLTPDPQTISIITNAKAAYFLDALSYSCSYVVEKKLIDKYGNDKFTDHLTEGGGDGPWTVSQYIHGKEIDFVPNPNYYGPKPLLKKVVMPFYKQADTTYKAYQVGQVDGSGVPSADLAAAKALPNGQFHLIPNLWISYYAMNFLTPPFNNLKIRQAFALAIDKDAIAHSVYKDTVTATNHIVPAGMPGYDAALTGPLGVKGTKGDPTQAKTLFTQGMQEAGYTLSTLPPITFTVATGGSADASHEFQAVQQMWQNTLGVSVKIETVDFNVLLNDIPAATNNPKGLQMWSIGWIADYPDPQDWLSLQFAKGAANNNSNFGQNNSADAAQQAATQDLMKQADVNPDQASRMQQYNQAEQQLVNDVAWLPMYQVNATIVRKPCVAGVVDNAQQLTPPDDWGSIFISTQTPCADTTSFQ
ncbi:MAG TPA: peptide ABC transporter substrate-binding protein [Ktedonosporobacter sp.]|jgi:peptide/nickel transport system substrate-binding protein/oligopeptide transport system substrate-binding protein|nr:peptide ABC transporter substrate-binding protein [Ktedonosporobacter sp.]